MKMLKKILEFFDRLIDRLPPYPIDPFPWMWWIIFWLILPLLLLGLI